MPSPARVLLPLALAALAQAGVFAVSGPRPGSWPAVLSSAGHVPGPPADADILVAPPGAPASPEWKARAESGAAVILEGPSPLAASFGFETRPETAPTVHLVDVHNPTLSIVWAKPLDLARAAAPPQATVFAKDRWTAAPLVAGYKLGKGAVLWVAADPGPQGYERFPYLIQSLADLGFPPSFRNSRLWAFFDYSYRLRADPDYLAQRWRRAGIAALHVASWHFYDPDPGRDEYLNRLIDACHRHAILVYAWVELPHVSEKFWADHPEWREKTGLLQDAQLDWRKLMNLRNPACAAAVRAGLQRMAERFDWDGVNLAELYFESLEGVANPARFTPMNPDVRADFQSQAGWDPAAIWGAHSDAASRRRFLDFRAGLARRLQEDWLGAIEAYRAFKPGLDIVLTHVDDRFDAGIRDAIGADAARVLPLLDTHSFTFLIEDPATVWNLGPKRYPEIAKRYQPLTSHPEKLAIDINIVDRYQDVYPTRQQTGTELFELVHLASAAFHQVALYFENSILPPDLPLLAASTAVVDRYSTAGGTRHIESKSGVELTWPDPAAQVDGRPWPFLGDNLLRLPPGAHTVAAGKPRDGISVVDLNAALISASADGPRVQFDYSSDSRAIVRFDRTPRALTVDGAPLTADGCLLFLPRGAHRVWAE